MAIDELDELEIDITDDIEAAIGDLNIDGERLFDIQLPTTIIRAAAVAAAQVLMAFERGYRMSSDYHSETVEVGIVYTPIGQGVTHTEESRDDNDERISSAENLGEQHGWINGIKES